MDHLKNHTVLVTGAGGSIGSELVAKILEVEPSVQIVAVDLCEYHLYNLGERLASMTFKHPIIPLIADVRHSSVLEHVFTEYAPHYVFHAAALKHVPLLETSHNTIEAIRTNVLGTKNVVDHAVRYGAKQFLMVSTDKAVNPTNVMGATKAFAEGYVKEIGNKTRGTRIVTTRFGNVRFSNGSVVPHFLKQIAEGGPVTVTHPDIERYMMSIDEAVRLIVQSSAYDMVMHFGLSSTYLLDMGQPVRILDLAKELIDLNGGGIDIKITGLRPGEKLFEELHYEHEAILKTDCEKLRRLVSSKDYQGFMAAAETLRQACDYRDHEKVLSVLGKMVPYTRG